MTIPHPIPYQGSKRRIARAILACFPAEVATLYEPFAGSAALTLAAAAANKAFRFALSDSNAALVALWAEILEHPDRLACGYAALWQAQLGRERDHYREVRLQFNRDPRPEQLLYLLARCVKAAVRYNAYGEFNQSADNRRRGARPATLAAHSRRASELLAGRTSVRACDYREAVAAAGSADLVYLDPPYQGVSAGRDPRYYQDVRFDDFVCALEQMNARGLSFIVSYDGHNSLRSYGRPLPAALGLRHISVAAGRSSQATLLGRDAQTVESLYLSPALLDRLQTP